MSIRVAKAVKEAKDVRLNTRQPADSVPTFGASNISPVAIYTAQMACRISRRRGSSGEVIRLVSKLLIRAKVVNERLQVLFA